MGNCASSSFVPWAGRNDITLAAKSRKKAAKEILSSYRAYSSAHGLYLESLKQVGSNLLLFMVEEDKGLLNLESQAVKVTEEPSDYRASWSQTPGALSDSIPPINPDTKNEGVSDDVARGAPSSFNHYLNTDTDYSDGIPPASNVDVTKGGPVPQNGQPQSLEMIPANAASSSMMVNHYPLQHQLPRGAGVSQLATTLNGLFLEAIESARPLGSLLAVGAAKKYSAPPPIPPQVQGGQQYGAPPNWGKPAESLWETLEILVAYERFRSKEIKALEKTKFDYERMTGRLGKQNKKTVSDAKAEKQQKKINKTHSKIQELQGNMNRMGVTVENLTRSIEGIKSQMLLPALLLLLPGLIHMWLQMAGIHNRQLQLIQEISAKGSLVNNLATGPFVLFTHPSHHKGTQNLENALVKWDQAFTANMASQKKILMAIITWLNRVSPAGVNPNPPVAYPAPGFPGNAPPVAQGNPYPYGSSLSTSASFHQQGNFNPYPPTQNSNAPQVTFPPESHPGGQVIPYFPPNTATGVPPSREMIQDFLGGQGFVGEPLMALCDDWRRATDKLPEKTVKDALFAYKNWVKDSYDKQSAELKQGKKVEDLQKQLRKAEQKYEGLLVKERDFRATLENPSGIPMSRALTLSSKSYQNPPYDNSPSFSSPSWSQGQATGQGGPSPSSLPQPMNLTYGASPLRPPSMSPTPPPPSSQPVPAASPPPPSPPTEPGALIPYQPSPTEAVSYENQDNSLDKAGAKAKAKEQAKEVKAFTISKEVDLALGALEGLRQKLKDEEASFAVMASEARKSAISGFEQSFPNYVLSLSNYATIASQMYGVLHFQHTRAWR